MKNLPVLLSLCVALALPVVGQQSSSSSDQAASASQSDLTPLPDQKPTNFWDGDDPNLKNLITHPFASKAYVRRHTQPIRDRLNELDQLTSEQASTIKDVDARSQKGLQLASEKVSLADQHATDAATKAQGAQTAANDASTHVSSAEQMVNNLDQYKGSAQTEIRFRPGQTVLSKTAKDALDQMATPLKSQRSYIIEVRGFAPGRGQAAITASQKMAESVARYLVLTHNIPVYRIFVQSMGNAAAEGEATAAKHATSARVEVSVLKNDMVSTAQR
ncbi:MAG TPA: OmpA family protein [Candidatus Sulfotelmatobacter sp.]|nr:OmpA family protein [Candidatus Sulfotelmatobacter sp.]